MSSGPLLNLLSGQIYSAMIGTVARLGIAEALSEGPLAVDEIARRCNADPDHMGRLLRAVAVLGLVEPKGETFGTTPSLRLLEADAERGLHAVAMLVGEPAFQGAWLKAAQTIRAGKSGFELAHGRPLFEFLDGNARLRDLFQRSLAGPKEWNQSFVEAIDTSACHLAVDVGAGDGSLLRALVDANPNLYGIAFDRPSVVATAAQAAMPTAIPTANPAVNPTAMPAAMPMVNLAEVANASERVKWVGGDYLSSVPPGGDLYLLRWVLHDLSDVAAQTLLRNCRAAMKESAQLCIVENLVDRTPGAALLDFTMMVLTGGRERTEPEYAALLNAADLTLDRTLTTPSGLCILFAKVGTGPALLNH